MVALTTLRPEGIDYATDPATFVNDLKLEGEISLVLLDLVL